MRYYLNALIGIGHHGDEQIDEDDDRYQHVDSEHNLEQILDPIGLCGRG